VTALFCRQCGQGVLDPDLHACERRWLPFKPSNSTFHRDRVDAYREERRRQEDLAEEMSLGYGTEYAEWIRDHPLITFRAWLRQSAGRRS
jgi:hypothetical protein